MTRPTAARLVMIIEPDSASGFQLAGASVMPVTSSLEAAEVLERLLAEGERGVIAVHEPFFDGLDSRLRSRIEAMVVPVVMPLPSGRTTAELGRRARLTNMLQRVVGYQINFEEPEP